MYTYSVAQCDRRWFDQAATGTVYLVMSYRSDLNLTQVHSVHHAQANADAVAAALNAAGS